MITEQSVVDKLTDGYSIWYAPISGGILLVKYNSDSGLYDRYEISIGLFLSMRSEGFIYMKEDRQTGHPLLHGRTQVYSFAKGELQC